MRIKLNEPDIGPEEIEAVVNALRSGQLTQGEQTLRFEETFANFVGSQSAVAVSSATTGLELALWALGIGPGDEVIVPDYSWPATGNAVVALGATPIFADIRLETFCIDIHHAETLVSPKTKAIMPVHAFGHMADMKKVNEMAEKNGLHVIEDAACAFGSSQDGVHAGQLGDFGVFSFHPRKIVTTGEGGMLIGGSPEAMEKAKLGRTHGAIRTGRFAEFHEFGFNFRISEMQAALGAVQISRGHEILARRRANALLLGDLLADIERVTLPLEGPGFIHSFQSYVVLLDGSLNRDSIIDFLDNRGIESTLGTYSMSSQPSFQRITGSLRSEQLESSRFAFRNALSLPMHSKLDESAIHHISRTFREAIRVQN
jgi:perosamine synthetase